MSLEKLEGHGVSSLAACAPTADAMPGADSRLATQEMRIAILRGIADDAQNALNGLDAITSAIRYQSTHTLREEALAIFCSQERTHAFCTFAAIGFSVLDWQLCREKEAGNAPSPIENSVSSSFTLGQFPPASDGAYLNGEPTLAERELLGIATAMGSGRSQDAIHAVLRELVRARGDLSAESTLLDRMGLEWTQLGGLEGRAAWEGGWHVRGSFETIRDAISALPPPQSPTPVAEAIPSPRTGSGVSVRDTAIPSLAHDSEARSTIFELIGRNADRARVALYELESALQQQRVRTPREEAWLVLCRRESTKAFARFARFIVLAEDSRRRERVDAEAALSLTDDSRLLASSSALATRLPEDGCPQVWQSASEHDVLRLASILEYGRSYDAIHDVLDDLRVTREQLRAEAALLDRANMEQYQLSAVEGWEVERGWLVRGTCETLREAIAALEPRWS